MEEQADFNLGTQAGKVNKIYNMTQDYDNPKSEIISRTDPRLTGKRDRTSSGNSHGSHSQDR